MSTISNFLNGRNAIDVLHQNNLTLDDVQQESITKTATGKFFVSDMYSTYSDTKEECLAKCALIYALQNPENNIK